MSNRDKKLLLTAVGILMLIVVIFNVFQPSMEEIDRLKRENQELAERIIDLEAKDAKKEEYQTQTHDMQNKMDQIVSEFPGDVKEETAIMYARTLENLSDMDISAVQTDVVNMMHIVPMVDETTVTLLDRKVTYTFSASYEDFKKVARTIQEDPDKRNMESVVLSFDDATGKLVGNMQANLYFMYAANHEYIEPETGSIPLGNSSIFGTMKSSDAESQTEDMDESTEE